jgi:hypothetical protein
MRKKNMLHLAVIQADIHRARLPSHAVVSFHSFRGASKGKYFRVYSALLCGRLLRGLDSAQRVGGVFVDFGGGGRIGLLVFGGSAVLLRERCAVGGGGLLLGGVGTRHGS